jgi:hypothetical protein
MSSFRTDFREFVGWYKALNFESLRTILVKSLPEIPQRLVYYLTTADRNSSEIEKISARYNHKIPARTIRTWQSDWLRAGLLREVGYQRREHIFDLSTFGIDIGVELQTSVEKSERPVDQLTDSVSHASVLMEKVDE